MSDFKAKMHQIRFRLGSLQRSTRTTQLDLRGLLLRGGRGREGPTYKGREGKEGKREREGPPGYYGFHPPHRI